MYEYKAKLDRVIDGDTIVVTIDLGFGVKMSQTLRLLGINCPELPTEAGVAAKAFTYATLKDQEFIVQTLKDKKEKYGRYLAVIVLPDGQTLNQQLIEGEFASEY